MTCENCESDPCTCQKALAAKQLWILQDCATPGCFTQIRTRVEEPPDPPICKWCQAGVSHALRPKTWPEPGGLIIMLDKYVSIVYKRQYEALS